MVKFYQVGGSVRDEILGIKSKDIDYSVEAESYNEMRQSILDRGGEIFLEKEEFLTIRARVPNLGACDYVLCRKDGAYSDGRRPDEVVIGNLYDDLARRDFTVNAIAKDEDGNYIDPYNGMRDCQTKTLRVVESVERLREDSLRMLRAIRFVITKDFCFSQEIRDFLSNWYNAKLLENISSERIREELHKCFKHDTYTTLLMLEEFCHIRNRIFLHTNLWLMPTSKE